MKFGKSAGLLFQSAETLGLKPEWITSYGLFSIKIGSKECYIFYGISELNSELACYLARNKHATRKLLDKHNLPNMPYCLPENYEELAEFFKQNNPIILKPTLGSRSRGVKLVRSSARLKIIKYKDKICEKYINGEEFRLIVIKNKIVAVQKRVPIGKINRPGKSTRINYNKSDWNKTLCELAVKAARALNLNYCAVDIIVDDKDKPFILEINTSPGMYYFEYPHKGPVVPISELYLNAVIKLHTHGK